MFPSDPVFCLGLFLWTGLKMQHFFPPPTLLLSPPYAKHRGKKFKVPGSFWPGGPTADKDTLFLVRILESDDKYKVNRRAVSLYHLRPARVLRGGPGRLRDRGGGVND